MQKYRPRRLFPDGPDRTVRRGRPWGTGGGPRARGGGHDARVRDGGHTWSIFSTRRARRDRKIHFRRARAGKRAIFRWALA